MITLHTFGPMFGLPDPSPFVTKGDVLLKMSGLPYRSVIGNLRNAPKGKFPYIESNGAKIGDTTLIRIHLEKQYGIDFDKHLSPTEKGIAWAVEKMLEDHLYWAQLQMRWMDDVNFNKGPVHFFDAAPALIRPLIVSMVRRKVRKGLHAHGLGRHSQDEIVMLACRAIDALAAVLGDKPYLLGAKPCGADATVLAFTASFLAPYFETPLRTHAEKHDNLVAYRDRLMREYYPAA
jgi:glutathione S-transferase